jgi:flagellar biogenesis protein FliO
MSRLIGRQLLMLVVLAALSAGTCWAESSSEPPTEPDTAFAAAFRASSLQLDASDSPFSGTPVDLGPVALRLAAVTVGVLIACVLTILVLRKYLHLRSVQRSPHGQSMSVEATLRLANRSCLQVVKLDQHRLVVGCDAGGLRSVILLPELFTDVMDAPAPEKHSERSTDRYGMFDRRYEDVAGNKVEAGTDNWELTKWKPQRPIT